MKHLILASTVILAAVIGCKKSTDNLTQAPEPDLQLLTVDPVIEAYSPFGPVERAPDDYTPQFSNCTNYIAVYLHTPTNGPYAGFTVEIYRFEDFEDISGPCGAEFDLTKETGTNANGEYNYCDGSPKDCYEGTVNGHCMLVFCDK